MTRIPILLPSAILLLTMASASSAALLESWQFNETAGTQFTGLVNDVGTASFSANKAQVVTDGLGALEFTQAADAADNVFRNATLTIPNQTTGIFELEYTILTATLNGGDAGGANVGFGMRDQGSNSDLFLVRLQRENSELRLQTRIGTTNTTLTDFNATTLPDTLKVRAVADLDADLLDVFTTLGAGAEQQVATDFNFSATGLDFDQVRLVANTNTTDWGASDAVTVDYLTVSDGLSAPGDVILEVNTTTGLLTIKNDTGSNLDMDFYEITSTNSLAPAGWNSLQTQNLPGFPAGNGTGNGWEELGLANPDADFNLDEIVDGQDLTKWASDYGTNGNSDADGDADSDGADFLAWQRSLGDTASPVSSLLSEGYLTDSSLLANGATLALGNGFQLGAAQDLGFKVRRADGTVLIGDVQYVTTAATTAVPEPTGIFLAAMGLTFVLTRTTMKVNQMSNLNDRSGRGIQVLLILVVTVGISGVTAHAAPDRSRPNIVVVYADDMGIGDTSAYQDLGVNPDGYQVDTPNLERLATMGTRFTDVHSSEAVCTPSRVSLLTGRYSFRSDLKQGVVFSGQDINGTLMAQGGKTTRTVGNLLQDVGYKTYGLGKWHVGVKTDSGSIDTSRTLLEGPTHVGFDRYIGTLGNPGGKGQMFEDDLFVKFATTTPGDLTTAPLSGADTPSTNWIVGNDDGALQQAKLTQRHLNASKTFMTDHTTGGAHEDKPFFLYYASHANHVPYYVADSIQTDADGTPDSVPITGNTVAGGPIRVVTVPDGPDPDNLPDPADPEYPVGTLEKDWEQYYEEDGMGNQIDSPASARADMVQANDVVLGELIDYLEVTDDPRNAGGKLIDNTLIIFTSDNGANLGGPDVGGLEQVSDGQPTDLRGKKGTQWEGGTRVPFIAAWAGEIQTGLTSDALFGQQDLYATFAEIADQQLEEVYADTEGADSESVLDALQGTATGVVRATDLIYKKKDKLILRRGNLKLITTESDFDDNGERIDPGGETSGLDWQDLVVSQLYDLSNDLDETVDLKNNPAWTTIRDDMFGALMAAIGPDAEAGFTRGIIADVNHDLSLDAADWQIFKAGFGDNIASFSDLAAYKRGDLDGDLDVDINDFSIFKGAYDLANGTGAFAAMVNAVPEPSTATIALLGAVLLATSRRKRRVQ